jgi:flagellar protein FlaG
MSMDISPVSLPATAGPGEVAPELVQTAPVANPAAQNGNAGNLKTGSLSFPSSDQVAQAVRQVNDLFAGKGQNLYAAFEKDQTTGITIVKIVDSTTNEIITQMPPKAIVEFARSLEQSQGKSGQIISFKA